VLWPAGANGGDRSSHGLLLLVGRPNDGASLTGRGEVLGGEVCQGAEICGGDARRGDCHGAISLITNSGAAAQSALGHWPGHAVVADHPGRAGRQDALAGRLLPGLRDNTAILLEAFPLKIEVFPSPPSARTAVPPPPSHFEAEGRKPSATEVEGVRSAGGWEDG
jgi:hypothetical protein